MPAEYSVARHLLAYAHLRAAALRSRRDNQWGASAIEWAIISAIVVGAAVLIGAAIKAAVDGKKNEMCEEDGINCS
jgi:Flp pilus assembly pilin Flp